MPEGWGSYMGVIPWLLPRIQGLVMILILLLCLTQLILVIE